MNRIRSTFFLTLLFSLLLTPLIAHSGGPKPSHTGGFGERTCVRCHKDFSLNEGRTIGGVFSISGIPRAYAPGQRYPLVVRVGHPGQARWGFQLTSRFSESGRQAGTLSPTDELTRLVADGEIIYIEHNEEGTRGDTLDGPVEFRLEWIAPQKTGPVQFNAAGNAADYSDDPTGDYIYTAGGYSAPATRRAPGELTQQTQEPISPYRRINSASRLVHIAAPVDLDKGDVEINIQHRFLKALNDSSPGDAFGIDFGANINLGLNYALTDKISVGTARTRFDRIIDFSGTYEVLNQDNSLWKMSLHGGVEGRDNFTRHYSPYLELASSFDVKRFRFFADPILVLNSRDDLAVQRNSIAINPADNHTFSVGLGVDASLTRAFSLSWEFVPRIAGFGGFGEENPAMSAAVKIRSWGHVFTIIASTSRTFTPGRYAVNTENDFSLGFNIYRRIR